MDDKNFDKIIREKVEGYQETGYDPSALEQLHQKMATHSPLQVAWYRKPWVGWAAAGVTIFLLSHAFAYGLYSQSGNEELLSRIEQLEAENSKIKNDLMAFTQDENASQVERIDTIYIEKVITQPVKQPIDQQQLVASFARMTQEQRKSILAPYQHEFAVPENQSLVAKNQQNDEMIARKELPGQMLNYLSSKGYLVNDNGHLVEIARKE